MKKFIAPLLTLSLFLTACSSTTEQELELSSEDFDENAEVTTTEEFVETDEFLEPLEDEPMHHQPIHHEPGQNGPKHRGPQHDSTEEFHEVFVVDEDECHVFHSDGVVELKDECEDDFDESEDHEEEWEDEEVTHEDIYPVDENECEIFFSDGFVEVKEECRDEFKEEEKHRGPHHTNHHDEDEQGPRFQMVEEDECHFYFEDGFVELKPECRHKEFEEFDQDFEDDFEEHLEEQVNHLREEVERLMDMLEDFEDFADETSEEFSEDDAILEAVEKVYDMIERSHEALESMKEEVEAGNAHNHWERVDKIRHAAHKQMEKLHRRIGERGHREMKMHIEFKEEMTGERAEDMFHEYYGEDFDFEVFEEHIDFEHVDQMVRNVPGEMMGQVMQHMHNPHGQHLMTNLMNNMHVLDERATQMMEYSMELMAVMEEVEIDDEDDARYDHLKHMFEKSMTFLSEDTHDEIISFWLEVRDVVARGATDDELASFESEIEALLEANQNALVDEGVQFHDVLLADDDWYFEHVIDLKERGVIDGKRDSNGELTGEYQPSSNVTNAEMLKILLESAGQGEADRDHSGLEGKWYGKYVGQANDLGLDLVDNWNEEADRGTVAIWTAQIFELQNEFDGGDVPFNDISHSDPYAAHYQAVSEYEIFSGDGSTGNLNPHDPINRAEAAKVAGKVIENVVEVETLDF